MVEYTRRAVPIDERASNISVSYVINKTKVPVK